MIGKEKRMRGVLHKETHLGRAVAGPVLSPSTREGGMSLTEEGVAWLQVWEQIRVGMSMKEEANVRSGPWILFS